jgi:hypothetical protein
MADEARLLTRDETILANSDRALWDEPTADKARGKKVVGKRRARRRASQRL